jgi:hypothetical protein
MTTLKNLRNDWARRLPAANSTYKKLAVQWMYKHLCFASSTVQADSFRLRNRQLLVAAKRYTQLSDPERAVTKGVKKDIE